MSSGVRRSMRRLTLALLSLATVPVTAAVAQSPDIDPLPAPPRVEADVARMVEDQKAERGITHLPRVGFPVRRP